jgi:hypothetical protein
MKCTPNEVHALEMHAREVHARETHAYEIHALEMHARKLLGKPPRSLTLQTAAQWSIRRDLSCKIRVFALRDKRSLWASAGLRTPPPKSQPADCGRKKTMFRAEKANFELSTAQNKKSLLAFAISSGIDAGLKQLL